MSQDVFLDWPHNISFFKQSRMQFTLMLTLGISLSIFFIIPNHISLIINQKPLPQSKELLKYSFAWLQKGGTFTQLL